MLFSTENWTSKTKKHTAADMRALRIRISDGTTFRAAFRASARVGARSSASASAAARCNAGIARELELKLGLAQS